MKKNFIIVSLAVMLAVSAAGCNKADDGKSALVDGQSTVQTTDGTQSPESTQQTDGTSENSGESSGGSQENGASENGTSGTESGAEFGENADKKVDMDKLEGTEAKSDRSGTKGDGEMTTCKIKIDEVKIVPQDENSLVVVQFDFKNTSSAELNFTGEVYAEAYQDGMELVPAVIRGEIEGYSPDTMMQKVDPGDSIKVQKAFITSDPDTPVEVYVRDTYDESGQKYLAQVFRVD